MPKQTLIKIDMNTKRKIFLPDKLASDKTSDNKEGMAMTVEDIITAEEVAGFLHIKTQTLYDNRWRTQSRCPLFRQGRRLFSYRIEFEKWFRSRMQYV